MQRGGGGWRQDSGHTQSDQRAAEADDEAVVGVDARYQRHGEASQFYQFLKAVGSDGDVRDLPGDGGTVADGDARVRLGQGRRVVDTVAHHQDSMPLPAEPGHILRFVCRKDSGAEVVHSHLGGNGCGGAVTVADEYIGAGDAVGHQILHLGVVRLMSQTTKLDFLRNSSYTNSAACDWKLGWNLWQVDT